jgi:hypothetical protein
MTVLLYCILLASKDYIEMREEINDHITNQLVAGFDSGWITVILKTTIEKLFMEKVARERRKEGMNGRWALFHLDNHSLRFLFADEQYFESDELKKLPIPPHSSSLIQPLNLKQQ